MWWAPKTCILQDHFCVTGVLSRVIGFYIQPIPFKPPGQTKLMSSRLRQGHFQHSYHKSGLGMWLCHFRLILRLALKLLGYPAATSGYKSAFNAGVSLFWVPYLRGGLCKQACTHYLVRPGYIPWCCAFILYCVYFTTTPHEACRQC